MTSCGVKRLSFASKSAGHCGDTGINFDLQKEKACMKSSILSKKEMQYILQGARRNKEEFGSLHPAIFVRTTTGEKLVCMIKLPGEPEAKQKYLRSLFESFRQDGHEVSEAVLVSESWTVIGMSADLEQAPSQHPERIEVIMVAGRDAEGKTFSLVIQPFEVRSGEINWKKAVLEMYNESVQSKTSIRGLLDYFFEG